MTFRNPLSGPATLNTTQNLVAVAIFCRQSPACQGRATLKYAGKTVGRTAFSLRPETTSHVPIRLLPRMIGLIRRHDGVTTRLTAVVNGHTFTQNVVVKIL
jgi:hypothetical protein